MYGATPERCLSLRAPLRGQQGIRAPQDNHLSPQRRAEPPLPAPTPSGTRPALRAPRFPPQGRGRAAPLIRTESPVPPPPPSLPHPQ